ncbi:hypothetical protein [Gemmata palustris]|nr:hypothetical protein [Gemmata palustris]
MDLEELALMTQIFCYVTLPAIIGWGVWKLTQEDGRKRSGDS